MPRRAIQFSAGNIGHQTPRLINGPTGAGSELVGAHVSDSEKVGRGATDVLIALHAVCVVSTSQPEARPHTMIKAIANFLARDTKVIGTWLMRLAAPHYADEWLRTPLQRSCANGQASLYSNGINPRFWRHPGFHALRLMRRSAAMTFHEICDYQLRRRRLHPVSAWNSAGLLMTRRSCFNLHSRLTVGEQARLTADYAVNMVDG